MPATHDIIIALLLTTVAGLSTGIGALVAFFTRATDTRVLSAALGLSAGVMVYVSMMELLPEAFATLGRAFDERTGEAVTLLTFFGGIAEGEPLHRFYGYVSTGIIETEEQAANAYYDALARQPKVGGKRVGDYEWADRNGDGQITKADQFCLGTTVPPFTGGLNNTFRLKSWTLSIYLDWAVGHSIFDSSYNRYFFGTFTNNYALAREVLKCWKKPGDDTRFAKFWANDSNWGNDNYNRDRNNNFTYKGLSLNIFFQWSYGNDIMNANRIIFEGNYNGKNINQFRSYVDHWTPENPTSRNFRPGGQGPRGVYSSRTIEDGSFLRLKTVQLSYTLPEKWVRRIHLHNVQIFVSGQNLWTWTRYSGLDPEVSTRNSALTPGYDYSAYARNWTYMAGLKIAF